MSKHRAPSQRQLDRGNTRYYLLALWVEIRHLLSHTRVRIFLAFAAVLSLALLIAGISASRAVTTL